ncbi:uncharacterized protein EKO05_0006601 [Ascochyta rabiei]|uniref:uncharacterized protein n=1 Tax=Didymella rabiei TaxID=5454 RepID=UPI0021FD12C8|nr:uncharacterized protein EKO05_0006601 [Ascochyta rabiei]UPX16187.1 hypothetical protein EKO05_0006601 [Ascochyta rabiei]
MAARLRAILGQLTPFTTTASTAQSVLMSELLAGVHSSAIPKLGATNNLVEWTQDLAKDTLHQMTAVVQNPHDTFSPVFREAYKKALGGTQMIEGFTKDHPLFSLVVALGVLYIMAPWVLQLLGFTSKGPALGSFAASWESTYGGFVPANTLFSYLQHLRMTVLV